MKKQSLTTSRWQWAVLGVLLLACALNTYRLGSESVWTDEGLTLTFASGSPGNILPLYGEIDEYHPPLHYLAWHYWIALTGRSEFAIRALSALVGILTVALACQMGRLLFGASAGLAAGLLVASSGFQVYYSQTVRVYSFLELLSLWSFYASFCLTRRFSFKNMAVYAAVTVTLLYTHLYGAFVLFSENIFIAGWLGAVWWKSGWSAVRARAGHWLFLQFALALAFLGWAPMVIYQFGHFTTVVAASPGLGLLVGTFIEFTWSVPAFVAVVCVLALGVYTWLRPRFLAQAASPVDRPDGAGRRSFAFLAAWLLGPFGMPVTISLLSRPIFLPRYGIPALPAFYLLVSGLALKQLRPSAGKLLVAAIVVFQLGGVANLYLAPNNEDWRGATAYLEAAAKPGDMVLFYSGWAKGAFDYYSRREDLHKVGLGYVDGPTRVRETLERNPGQTGVWLALTYADPADFEGLMRAKGYTLMQERDFFRISLAKYQK